MLWLVVAVGLEQAGAAPSFEQALQRVTKRCPNRSVPADQRDKPRCRWQESERVGGRSWVRGRDMRRGGVRAR